MDYLWLMPLCLNSNNFSDNNTHLFNPIFLDDYNRFSKKYARYGSGN